MATPRTLSPSSSCVVSRCYPGGRPERPVRRHYFQQGMAVIGALMVVVVASLVASRLIERQGSVTQALIVENDRIQAKWLLRGGLDWARTILEWDGRSNAITRGDAVWNQAINALEIPLPGDGRKALFSGHIEDAQARFNLNNLARNGQIQTRYQQMLARLLDQLGLPAMLAESIAVRVAQSQPSSRHEAQFLALQHVDDLASLPGVTPDILARLRPFITVLPEPSPVNANTASAEVLSALYANLSLADARQQIIERDKGLWFTNPADFLNRVQLRQSNAALKSTLSTSSNWFNVIGHIRFGQAQIAMQALLYRDTKGLPVIQWVREL